MMFRFLAVLLLVSPMALGHNVPSQLPDPQSDGEAWNVIEGSAENIDRLLDANLLRDITFQIANTDSSLRFLIAHPTDAKDPRRVKDLCRQMLADGSALIGSIRDNSSTIEKIKSQWHDYRQKLGELESSYTTELLHSDVFICPMHPLDRHLKPDEKCSICGMSLIRRHLPSSSVYEKPGEPTIKMSVQCSPLAVGQPAKIRIQLAKNDGSPVVLDDLVEMHTKKIHLLINDSSLSDYHHEHPTPTGIPGEYAFGFTPSKPGPYRIWADVVPAVSSIQEYVIADIPATTPPLPLPLANRDEVSTAIVNGRKYVLSLNNGKPIHVGQTVIGTISVAEADGKPCVNLEPIMGAFAHIVGFNEDHKTVLHIHPYGKEPASPADRAGPAFAFKFYSPTPGFFRLYGQVQIDGISQFAPFGATILPAEKPVAQP